MDMRRIGMVMVFVALLGWVLSLPASSSEQQTILRVSPTSLNFEDEVGMTPRAKLLTLVNTGEAVLHWQATTDVDWIILGAPKGSMAGKQVIRLLILVNTQGLGAGVRQGTVTLKNLNVEEAPTQVAVKLTLREAPKLEVSPSRLSFSVQEGGSNPSSQVLAIRNTGGKALSWTASENLGWLSLSRTKGTLDAGENTQVTVSVDVSGLSAGNNKGQILLFSRAATNSPLFVDVTLTVSVPKPTGPPAGMVEVPRGNFEMGDSFGEGDSDELPVHTVNVSGFYMDKFEVTKGLWDEVAGWATSHGYDIGPGDGSTSRSDGTGNTNEHPVTEVSWYEAVKWEADGYRLPTEAEWEKGARGGLKGNRYPWGDGAPSCVNGVSNGVRYNSCRTGTAPVGSFKPNGYGLYDMAGNMWEWNWDWRDSGYYANSAGVDPRGPVSGSLRVHRGGSWFNLAFNVRVAFRGNLGPGFETFNLGFRLVRAVTSLP